MSNYYHEEVEKNTRHHKAYLDGINRFLDAEKGKADTERKNYISPGKYIINAEKYREDLIKTFGFPLTEKRATPVLKEKKFVARDGNVDIYRMSFSVMGMVESYGLYFEQTENPKDKPFVFCIHGGEGTPESISSIHFDSGNYNHLTRRITDKGANVFAPQMLLWKIGTYGTEYNRSYIDGRFRQLGGSISAFELSVLRSYADYFIDNNIANKDRIGVAGLSYGGMYAICFAAIDTRIKACYSCSWVNDTFVHSWADWSYFNAQKRFTTVETCAMIAPRPLVVAMGDKDNIFDSNITVKSCEKVKEYYAAFGKESDFKCIIFDGVHETDKSDFEIDFLLKNL